ncbi:hypothetical protein [Kribbella lupini]|uniref:Uncharacterized protein n=1 Tax=Kribbella lupini TaxID=291602 RepID=A0ABN2ALW5_9ACTN
MTDSPASLQLELTRWEHELDALENESIAEGWSTPERLLAAMQSTVAAYQRRILPRLRAEHDLAVPDAAAITSYDVIVEDELVRQVQQLDDLRRDLITQGNTTDLQLRIAGTFAALRALATVTLRFGQQAERPPLDQRATRSPGLGRAVRRYERSLR